MDKRLAILAALLVLVPFGARAQAGEAIRSFSSDIVVNTDASIDVKETIVYDFGAANRHGIYRDVPVDYKTSSGKRLRLDLADITVQDEGARAYPFSVSLSGGVRRIKIGDPDITVTGIHTYVIHYRVPRAVGFFDDHDEIYWNVTGNEWQVPILKAEARVTVPYSAATAEEFERSLSIACYAGPRGSTRACSSVQLTGRDPVSAYFSQENLNPSDGLTVAVGFPKGNVVPPTASDVAADSFRDAISSGWWLFILPVVVLIWRFRKWKREGRDPKGTGIIVAQYEAPDGLTPMQTRFVLSQDFGSSLSADIVHLATKGYLKIAKIKTEGILGFGGDEDYRLTALKSSEDLPEHQRGLFDYLFAIGKGGYVDLSDLKDRFYMKAAMVQEKAVESLVIQGYFPRPTKGPLTAGLISGKLTSRRAAAVTGGIVVAVFGSIWGTPWVMAVAGEGSGLSFIIAWILSVAIWSLFSVIMPRLTEKGVAAKEHIQGFKLYLSVAEKDRIDFHNAPAKDPQTFEKLLPYAMALGVEKEWGKVFEGIDIQPSWYSDPSMGSFHAAAFAANMSSFAAASASDLSSAPGSHSGSGGGGFSGGGGGGGGGGSW